jgi:hypothetical protein
MTAAPGFWVADPGGGDRSLVPAAERDELVRQGWAAVGEPADDDMVTIWLEGVAEPGRVPAAALRELWGPRGWVAGPPPGGAHPAAPKPAVESPAPKSSKSSASSGEVKEKSGA